MSERTEYCRLTQRQADELQALLTPFYAAAYKLRSFLVEAEADWEQPFSSPEGSDLTDLAPPVPSDASARWHTLIRWRRALDKVLSPPGMAVINLGEVVDEAWLLNQLLGDDHFDPWATDERGD